MTYKFENTYWCDNGKYQKESDELYAKLVPNTGMAETTDGEALRCVTNIYYDLYNNGGGNFDVREDQWKHFKRWFREKEYDMPEVGAINSAFDGAVEECDSCDGYGSGWDEWDDECTCGMVDFGEPGSHPIWAQMELLIDSAIEYLLD